ncbi:MAG TPA: hypothetical protein VI791_01665 [Patescibacteria group bacterium]|nr:hypothetical protein [Patescibacteria group bacterium]
MREYSLEFPSRELAIELLCLDSLGEVDQKRVLDFVTYNGDFDPKLIAKAVGRNILFPLIESIGSLDTVQISGAGYFDFGITDNDGKQAILIPDSGSIRPPQEDTDRFTHTTTVVIGGETTSLVQQSPLGSYTEKAAREKFTNSIRAARLIKTANCPFLVPLPIARIHYSNIPDGQGGRQSALVWGCPARGARAEDLIRPLLELATVNTNKKREVIVIEKFSTYFLSLLHTMGSSARFLHEQGLCHYQMTYGNVSPLLKDQHGKPKICLYDWETLLPTDATNPLLARGYDMSTVLGSNSAILELLANRIKLSPETLITLGYNSFLHFLSGYTGLDPEGVHSRLELTRDEISKTFLPPQKILALMVDTVLPKIDS